ncbi:MAG TPA: hypothetical protein VKH42_12715, partial [Vicinamibacterales bacterium]|nr:hypothetical protein [Vicinamibacterales bacterium]
MRWTLTLAATVVLACASRPAAQRAPGGALDPPRSPRNASYTIAATLDPSARTISGTETIAWRNISNTTATELQFHLYWNAWKNDRSTFMRERALAGGAGAVPESDRSQIDVTAIRLGGATLTGSQRF